MEKEKLSNSEKLAIINRVREKKAQGEKIGAICKSEGIKTWDYYRWEKVLSQKEPSPDPEIILHRPAPQAPRKPMIRRLKSDTPLTMITGSPRELAEFYRELKGDT